MSGNSERVVPLDKDIAKKKNPPAATDGLNTTDFENLEVINISIVVQRVKQGHCCIREIINLHRKFASEPSMAIGLADSDRVHIARRLEEGFEFYRQCLPMDVREQFHVLFGLPFLDLEGMLHDLVRVFGQSLRNAGFYR